MAKFLYFNKVLFRWPYVGPELCRGGHTLMAAWLVCGVDSPHALMTSFVYPPLMGTTFITGHRVIMATRVYVCLVMIHMYLCRCLTGQRHAASRFTPIA